MQRKQQQLLLTSRCAFYYLHRIRGVVILLGALDVQLVSRYAGRFASAKFDLKHVDVKIRP